MADARELDIDLPPPGQVHESAPRTNTRRAAAAMRDLSAAATFGSDGMDRAASDVLPSMALAFADQERVRRIGAAPTIDSRQVVHACIDYATVTQRIPSITELCITAHVSERRLREAFVVEFDLPPSRFFRNWALQVAQRRLVASDPQQYTVTEIAADIGFGHLGRFAAYDEDVFGESPSRTPRKTARSYV